MKGINETVWGVGLKDGWKRVCESEKKRMVKDVMDVWRGGGGETKAFGLGKNINTRKKKKKQDRWRKKNKEIGIEGKWKEKQKIVNDKIMLFEVREWKIQWNAGQDENHCLKRTNEGWIKKG